MKTLLRPSCIIMADPTYFDVQYAINPHMQDQYGNLNKIDKKEARSQWENLRKVLQCVGLEVLTIPAKEGLPDLVFTANQSFPFKDVSGRNNVVLSTMNRQERKPEVELFRAFYSDHGYVIHEPPPMSFEGMGDAIWNYETQKIFCGYGFRTSQELPKWLSQLTGYDVVPLELTSDQYYHLDTCLVILGAKCAGYVKSAFSQSSQETLKQHFDDLFEIDEVEALNGLAANAFCATEKDVIVQSGLPILEGQLRQRGYHVYSIETGEYLKSGGSVFCMKLAFW